MPFPMPSLFITAVKDMCTVNTFEKLLNISALQHDFFLQLQMICL